MQSPRQALRHRLSVNGEVLEGRLSLHWTAGPADAAALDGLAAGYLRALRALIAHCAQPEVGGLSPADLPLAGLRPAQLGRLLASLGLANTRAARQQVADAYPLSPLQQGMLFHSLPTPEQGLYVEQIGRLPRGALDTDVLRSAWAGDDKAPRHSAHAPSSGRGSTSRSRSCWAQSSCRSPSSTGATPTPRRRPRSRAALHEPTIAARGFATRSGAAAAADADPGWPRPSYRAGLELPPPAARRLVAAGAVPRAVRPRTTRCGSAGAARSLRRRRPYRDYIAWLQRQDLRRGRAASGASSWPDFSHADALAGRRADAGAAGSPARSRSLGLRRAHGGGSRHSPRRSR